MGMNTNVIMVIGRLVAEIELKFTSGGKALTEFSLAVGEYKDDVSFFNVTAWDKVAENMDKYTYKGQLLCVMGSLKQNRWKTDDGSNRSKTFINARTVEFLSYKDSDNNQQPQTESEDVQF